MALTIAQKERGVELLSMLNDIDWINSGGCLYACLGVYKALEKEGIKDEDIVIVQLEHMYQSETITENKKFIEGRNKTAFSSSHFGLSFDGGDTYYDSDGQIAETKYPLHLIIPNKMIEKFSNNALEYGGWNPMFDRYESVPQINKMLNLNLDCYE